ncbi:MAG: cytochrome c3 family protein, partial [Vicinamibacterales bacterium]
MSAVGRLLLCVVTLLGVTMAGTAAAQDVVTSTLNKHNLSSSGPGPVKTNATTEVCIFCHAPHNSSPTAPLWNQTLSGATYTPYTSTTMAAAANVPTGSSKLCLSCHDGTIAVASTLSRGQITMSGVTNGVLAGASNIGTNLTSSHPVSIVPVTGSEIINPPAGHAVGLDATGRLQCVSCHDPHQMNADATTHKFLAMGNASSALCVTCHRKQYWTSNPSSHMTSTKAYVAAQGAHTGYTTVATNGCESCHKVHLAAQGPHILKAREELTCGGTGSQCHSTTGIGRNIHAEFNKTYSHPTYSITPSVHDPAESPTSVTAPLPERTAGTPRHAECGDCHNAHASYNAAATAPKASGKLAGVWGINRTGAMVLPSGTPSSVNEYEICFKCHGDSANLPQGTGGPA